MGSQPMFKKLHEWYSVPTTTFGLFILLPSVLSKCFLLINAMLYLEFLCSYNKQRQCKLKKR